MGGWMGCWGVLGDGAISVDDEGRGNIPLGDRVMLNNGCNFYLEVGIEIGAHSMIGAGAIMTKDIPERAVAVRNPVKAIRTCDCPDNLVRR
jgi:acetyltransferase-like isoleucine patch superfamily enzyme